MSRLSLILSVSLIDRRTGDSPFYDNIMLWAVSRGVVGVNMTYRLAPQNAWPAAQEDIGKALAWVRANIAARGPSC